MSLKQIMVKYSTNFLSFFTKRTTFLKFLSVKHKNEIKIVKKKILVPLLNPKRANGLKTSYREIFDKLLVFFHQKYHFLEILDTKTQKRNENCQKKILVLLLTLKHAKGLKTRYGEIFHKLLVSFDQKYHFLEILDTKTQRQD